MIIQCPRCSTRWRVGEPAATDNPVFKCGRCHSVFPQFPGAPAEATGSAKARETPPEPDNLEFIFPRRTPLPERVLAREDAIAPLREMVHEPPPDCASTDEAAPAAIESDDQPPFCTTEPRETTTTAHTGADRREADRLADDIDAADLAAASATAVDIEDAGPTAIGDDDGDEFTLGSDTLDDDDAEGDPDDHDDPTLGDVALAAPEPARPPRVVDVEAAMRASARSSAFRPATRLLLALVVAFALLAVFLRTNPARSEEWLGRIPLVGGKLAADAVLGRRITLTDVQGGFQRLRTGRRIFVISGKATNNALVAVERIEVEGALYAASGNVDRKVISTGNKTTLKLRDLNESEIALLQRLDARQPVAPGASVDFAIVFLEPPRDLREFSSRVLTVRSTGRASDPAAPGNPASVG